MITWSHYLAKYSCILNRDYYLLWQGDLECQLEETGILTQKGDAKWVQLQITAIIVKIRLPSPKGQSYR